MTTTVELQARLTSIKKARDSGVLLVRHGETTTQFRSLREMDKIIAELEGEISGATPRRVRYMYQKGKGL